MAPKRVAHCGPSFASSGLHYSIRGEVRMKFPFGLFQSILNFVVVVLDVRRAGGQRMKVLSSSWAVQVLRTLTWEMVALASLYGLFIINIHTPCPVQCPAVFNLDTARIANIEICFFLLSINLSNPKQILKNDHEHLTNVCHFIQKTI